MKTLILVIIFSLNLSASHQDELVIKNKLKNQVGCWNKGDLEGFMADYWKSEQLLFIGKSGLTNGWENALNNYKNHYPTKKEMGELKLEVLEMKRLDKSHYFTVGKWHLKREVGDLSGHFSLVWERMHNNWVIIADHSS